MSTFHEVYICQKCFRKSPSYTLGIPELAWSYKQQKDTWGILSTGMQAVPFSAPKISLQELKP